MTKYVELYWRQPVRPANREQDELEYQIALELDADAERWEAFRHVASALGSVALAAAICVAGVLASPYLQPVRALTTMVVLAVARQHGAG